MSVKLDRIYDEDEEDCDGCGESARHRLIFVGNVVEVCLCMVCLTKLNIRVGAYVTRQR